MHSGRLWRTPTSGPTEASIQTYVKRAAEVADIERQLRVTIIADPKPPRAHALISYRCQRGCAFWRTPSSPRSGDVTACPYKLDVVCALRRV